MSRYLADVELIVVADSLLQMGCGGVAAQRRSMLWNEAVYQIASHLKWLQQHGRPIPGVLASDHDSQQATAEWLQHMRDRLRASVVAEGERHAKGEPN